MIQHNTQSIKAPHYTQGFFSTGTGPEVIVLLGSCRIVPYLNFLNYLNKDNRFTLVTVDVVNFSFDEHDKSVDGREFSKRFESSKPLLDVLRKCRIFIHEHTANYGMFNTDKAQENHIYKWGMNPEVDIGIPNFNNIFVMFQEYMDYDTELRNEAKAGMTPIWAGKVQRKGLDAIEHFLGICKLSSLPEFGTMFAETWRNVRYFWTGNHVSNKFTGAVFGMMNDRFLHLPTDEGFWNMVKSDMMYSTPCAPITSWDRRAYGLTWPELDEPLKIP